MAGKGANFEVCQREVRLFGSFFPPLAIQQRLLTMFVQFCSSEEDQSLPFSLPSPVGSPAGSPAGPEISLDIGVKIAPLERNDQPL